ncbi:hypothetical protein B0T10DRAFT_553415 [Thelonectria olida]|uniref:Uncharacterized protein n=1 Tax=Thelonectria olida TaxID=1576542 RepID=A0A9P9AIP8_9HYPO|nr:hypothetical protein B0T10DRAFT_553415 [Thelonectria olida]
MRNNTKQSGGCQMSFRGIEIKRHADTQTCKTHPQSNYIQVPLHLEVSAMAAVGASLAQSTTAKHAHRHIAELYYDPSKENEKTIRELREEAIHELLGRVVRNSPVQQSVTGSRGPNFIPSFDEVVMRTEVEVTQSSPRSPPCSALFLPPVEYDWDENSLILSQPSSPKDLRPEAGHCSVYQPRVQGPVI